MATMQPPVHIGEFQHVLLHDVSWKLYQQLLKEVGDGTTRLTFDNGSLEIMSPLPPHELMKKRIGRMIEIVSLELNISMIPLGSTTFISKDLQKGLEPDECYYIAHAPDIAGKKRIDLKIDPPPDLVLEVDMTSRSIKREPIYAAMGVAELWRFSDGRLRIHQLTRDRQYRVISRSPSFPFLPLRKFEGYLLRLNDEDQTSVLREFRDWVITLSK